jgi:acetyltransferase-like isoleucine patch superfamily enzyme
MSKPDFNSFEDPLLWVSRAISKLHSLWLSWTYPFVSVGSKFSAHYSCDLRRPIASHIKIGNSVRLDRGVSLNISGVPKNNEPIIILEDYCGVARRTVISARNRIHIARDTILGPSAIIMDHDDAHEDAAVPNRHPGTTMGGTIRIEEGCWIGLGAVIICSEGELVIGRNSVVGANSVVSESIPPYSVVMGNPARLVKRFDPSKQAWVLGSGGSTGKG